MATSPEQTAQGRIMGSIITIRCPCFELQRGARLMKIQPEVDDGVALPITITNS